MSRENGETVETVNLPAVYDQWSSDESGNGTLQGTLITRSMAGSGNGGPRARPTFCGLPALLRCLSGRGR